MLTIMQLRIAPLFLNLFYSSILFGNLRKRIILEVQSIFWLHYNLQFQVIALVFVYTLYLGSFSLIFKIKIFLTVCLCFLQFITGENRILHNSFREQMGACISSQSKYLQNSTLPSPSQSNQLKTEIAKQLKEPSIQELSDNLTFKPEIQPAEAKIVRSPKKSVHSTQSDQVEELKESSSKRERKLYNQMHKIPYTKDNNISFEEMTKNKAEKQSASQSQSNEDSKQSEETRKNQDFLQIMPETPLNRITQFSVDEVGNGLTGIDNKLIASTLCSQVPMRLGEVKLANNSSYIGEWLKGKRQGQGVVRWQDGSMYSGQWQNNCSHGKGRLTYSNSGIYEGDFVCNKAQGKGVFYYPDGSKYEGDWRNDEREGRGLLSWKDGQKYDGNWLNNKKQGYGELFFRDGSFYKGEFNSNQIHGRGFYSWNKSKEYNGQWQHNQMCGLGILKWANGQIYEGCFLNSKCHGEGILTLLDGSASIGQWQKGRKQGIFQQKDIGGKIQMVEWHLGKKVKHSQTKEKKLLGEQHTSSSQTYSF